MEKKYLVVLHSDIMGYCFIGTNAKKYVPVLEHYRKNCTLKEFAQKYGFTYKGRAAKSYWAKRGARVFAVEVA